MPRTKENDCHYKGQQNNEIMCPFCDHKNDIDIADWTCNDGDEEVEECSNCGKQFKIFVSVMVSFESDYK